MTNDDWKRFSKDPLMGEQPCASCASNAYEAKQSGDVFFMQCPACGKRGPAADTLYDAQVGWQKALGGSSLNMADMTRVIVIALLLAAAALLILNALLG